MSKQWKSVINKSKFYAYWDNSLVLKRTYYIKICLWNKFSFLFILWILPISWPHLFLVFLLPFPAEATTNNNNKQRRRSAKKNNRKQIIELSRCVVAPVVVVAVCWLPLALMCLKNYSFFLRCKLFFCGLKPFNCFIN